MRFLPIVAMALAGCGGARDMGEPAHCTDHSLNGGESDVDCGGSCPACAEGAHCALPSDCITGRCTSGFCTPALCPDGLRDGDETDVDCGGSDCAPCADGNSCAIPSDCLHMSCDRGVCYGPLTCTFPMADCDSMPADGCSVNLDEDPANCGGCHRACNGKTPICRSGKCTSAPCSNGVSFAKPVEYPAINNFIGSAAFDVAPAGLFAIAVVGRDKGVVGVFRQQLGGLLAGRVDYPVGSSPSSVAAADLDGDGFTDLIVADFMDGQVYVLYSQGGAGFGPAQAIGQTDGIAFLVTADFDGDGAIDIAFTQNSGSSVGVIRNLGNGQFGPVAAYPTDQDPYGIAVGDLDGDQRPDLVVTGYTPATVSVLLNTGKGFAGRSIYPTAQFPASVALADIDGDGKVDVVTGNESDSISLLHNKGGAVLDAHVELAAWPQTITVVAADFDGDGWVDVAANAQSGDNQGCYVSLFANHGGVLAPKADFLAECGYPLVAKDFDGDAKPDLANGDISGKLGILLTTCQ